jgi:hypothetical protein
MLVDMRRMSFRVFALSLVCALVVSTGWDALRTVWDPDLPLWTDFVCLGIVFVLACVVLARRTTLTTVK